MANMGKLYINSGTSTIATDGGLTYTTGTSNSFSSAKVNINNLHFKKAAKIKTVKREIGVRKGFWDDVEWKEFKTWMPRKSITGKIIVGKIHKRYKKIIIPGSTTTKGHVISTVLGRETSRTQYANTKELFEEKLRGKA